MCQSPFALRRTVTRNQSAPALPSEFARHLRLTVAFNLRVCSVAGALDVSCRHCGSAWYLLFSSRVHLVFAVNLRVP